MPLSLADLSEMEHAALAMLAGGERLAWEDILGRSTHDVLGSPIPGRKIWQRLIQKGLIVLPEEEPLILEDGSQFTFTAFLELTMEGNRLVRGETIEEPDPSAEPDSP